MVHFRVVRGLIAVVCITAVTLLGNQINTVFTDITTDLTNAGIKG